MFHLNFHINSYMYLKKKILFSFQYVTSHLNKSHLNCFHLILCCCYCCCLDKFFQKLCIMILLRFLNARDAQSAVHCVCSAHRNSEWTVDFIFYAHFVHFVSPVVRSIHMLVYFREYFFLFLFFDFYVTQLTIVCMLEMLSFADVWHSILFG